jgi:hypothetical protein
MPVYRIAYFANGADVDTVLVDDNVMTEDRRIMTVNEGDVLETAQAETERMPDRTGLRALLDFPPGSGGTVGTWSSEA